MAQDFDQFIKEVLCRLASPFGVASANEQLITDAPMADLVFRHGTMPQAIDEELRLVARMFASTCIIEGYHQTPRLELVMDCLRKQLVLQHREALAAPGASLPVPMLWVLSSGKPVSAIEGLGFTLARDWFPGVYVGPAPALPACIVAINELPAIPETLIWRLFGAGRVLEEALSEMRARPLTSTLRSVARRVIHELGLQLSTKEAHERTAEEEEFRMLTESEYQAHVQELIQKGEAKGKAEGEAKGKAEGEARGEALAVLKVLATRGVSVTKEQRQRILACTDGAELDGLLRRAVLAASIDDVLN